jgi:hypothetical protein
MRSGGWRQRRRDLASVTNAAPIKCLGRTLRNNFYIEVTIKKSRLWLFRWRFTLVIDGDVQYSEVLGRQRLGDVTHPTPKAGSFEVMET